MRGSRLNDYLARRGARVTRLFASRIEAPGRAPRITTVTVEHAGAWKPIGIVAGALVLVLGAAELVTLGRMRAARIA
jgi:hypothetical protein